MLNKKLVLSASVVALMSVSSLANAGVEVALSNICEVVKTDDKSELRKKMKRVRSDFKMRLADYYGGVSCGGNSLIRTALLSNAVESGTLLVKKMPKDRLSEPETDGQTLTAWVEQQGLADNPIAIEIKNR